MNQPQAFVNFCPSLKIQNSKTYLLAKEICLLLSDRGKICYFVGGAVRDFFLNPESIAKDIDLATDADISEIEAVFGKQHVVGNKFSVTLLRFKGCTFELAQFRTEGDYLDYRHPETVKKASPLEDSNRRDFTMNAIYFDPVIKKVLDFHSGLADIRNGVLRCVGKAEERFYEDPLRILRMFRFQCAYSQLSLDTDAIVAAQKLKQHIHHVSPERILSEIKKIKPGCFLKFMELCLGLLGARVFDKNFEYDCNFKLPLNFAADIHCFLPVTSVFLCFYNTSFRRAEVDGLLKSFLNYPTDGRDLRALRFVYDVWCWSVNDKKNYSEFKMFYELYEATVLNKNVSLMNIAKIMTSIQISNCAEHNNTFVALRNFLIANVTEQSLAGFQGIKTILNKTMGINLTAVQQIQEFLYAKKMPDFWIQKILFFESAVCLAKKIQLTELPDVTLEAAVSWITNDYQGTTFQRSTP